MKLDEYWRKIEEEFQSIQDEQAFVGRNQTLVNAKQKHHLARIFNVFGYSYGRWLRFLEPPTYPTRITVQGRKLSAPPPSSGLSQVHLHLKTRSHPKRNDLVCAIYQKGGCSKAFSNVKELEKWVSTYPDWKTRFQTTAATQPPPKSGTKRAPSSIISAMQKDFADLLMKYDYEEVTIGGEEYLIFDVERDHITRVKGMHASLPNHIVLLILLCMW